MANLIELFEDPAIVSKIKAKLPYLFQLAELESFRAGKIGIEIDSVRKRILFGEPISIKIITGNNFGE
jgi:hypothetical protein